MIFDWSEENQTSLGGHDRDELLDFHMSASDDGRTLPTTSASSWPAADFTVADRGHLLDRVLSTFGAAAVVGKSVADYADWPTAGLEDVDTSHMKYPGEFRHIPPWEFAVKVSFDSRVCQFRRSLR